MIDEKVFRDAWALLCDRFGRQPSTPLMLAYYKTLNDRMTTAQFKASAQRIFVEREFFPRPADFLGDDTKASALEQWEQVQDLMRGFGNREALNAESKRVVLMLGGESKLRSTPLDAMQYVRRDFLALYGDAAEVAQREAGGRIEATREGRQIAESLVPRLLSDGNDAA